jgi:2-polyprenyl-3-methyl-5-hydroxy-6-metoxy-1,4-benzoquinol methylase
MPSRDYHERIWEGVPEGLDPPEERLRRAFLLEHVDPQSRVLDVGCGEGHFAAELAQAGISVVGVDVAEEPLRRARSRYPSLDLRIVPAEDTWPLPDAGFEVVWAGETIEHVADTPGWFSEMRRLLLPGGSLLLSTPAHGRFARLRLALSGKAFDAHFDPRADHLRFYTRRTLRRSLEDSGFRDIQVREAGGPPGARRLLLASARTPG